MEESIGNSTQPQNRTLARLPVILGPTASGKSSLGIILAQHFSGEIVSADSRQVYRGMDIGTAKVTLQERALVAHHLLDVVEPGETYTVSQYQHAAIEAINEILARGKQPFLVGGSPHYIQTIVDNFDIPAVPPQPELRARLEAQTLEETLAQLERLDPQSYATIDRRNPRRVIRALEVCLVTGKPFSAQRGKAHPLYHCLLLGIQWPREILYQRIDERVDERMREGMVEEVRTLLAQGVSHERMEALGLEYRFINRWLRGAFASEDEMVQKLKYAIHDFTRRQLTWFRRDKRIIWLEGGNDLEQRAIAIVQDFLS